MTEMTKINPNMIVLARESRGYTQSALAKMIGVRQGTLSKVENGQAVASDELLDRLADALEYPRAFFVQDYAFRNLPLSFFRKRLSVTATVLRAIAARMNIVRFHLMKLLRSADVPPARLILANPRERAPEEIARELRARWHLARGPIANLTSTLEGAGVLVLRFDFGTTQVDGLSVYGTNDALPPVIMVDPTIPGDRARFTIAHELGHVVLHHHLDVHLDDTDIEDEADRFAAEFLMPQTDIRGHLVHVSLPRLVSLKPYWKVSMQALLQRAGDLGLVSERRRRHLWMQLGRRGYRSAEPVTIGQEPPSLIDELVDFHLKQLGYTEQELSSAIALYPREFRLLYRTGTTPLRVVK